MNPATLKASRKSARVRSGRAAFLAEVRSLHFSEGAAVVADMLDWRLRFGSGPMAEGAVTNYGFEWGPLEVTRTSLLPGERVKTPYKAIDIYCSATGRSLRVFDCDGGGELKAPSDPA
jgi:hypothetical protein